MNRSSMSKQMMKKGGAAKPTKMMKGGMAKYVKGGLKKPTEAQAGVQKLNLLRLLVIQGVVDFRLASKSSQQNGFYARRW